jgi:hypothetical protein
MMGAARRALSLVARPRESGHRSRNDKQVNKFAVKKIRGILQDVEQS